MSKSEHIVSDLLNKAWHSRVSTGIEQVTMIPIYRDKETGRLTLKPAGPLLGQGSTLPEDRTVHIRIYDTISQADAARKTLESLGVAERCMHAQLRSGEGCLLIEMARGNTPISLEDMRLDDQRIFPATLSTDWPRSEVVRFFDAGLDACLDPYWRGKKIAQLCAMSVTNSVVLASCQSALESVPGARLTIDAISAEMVLEEIEDNLAMLPETEDVPDMPSLFSIHFHLRSLIASGRIEGMSHEDIVERIYKDLVTNKK